MSCRNKTRKYKFAASHLLKRKRRDRRIDQQRHLVLLCMLNSNVNTCLTAFVVHEGHSDYPPSITARIWTVSDHQWSKALKLQIGFTLRMRNCVSSSWFERLRISDGKLVNHTTEMILWSMILKMALWAVELTQGQPKQLVLVDFCSAALERDWALIVGTVRFRFGAPWL